jgi:hypothetical protein
MIVLALLKKEVVLYCSVCVPLAGLVWPQNRGSQILCDTLSVASTLTQSAILRGTQGRREAGTRGRGDAKGRRVPLRIADWV